jgi:hypothetical protein
LLFIRICLCSQWIFDVDPVAGPGRGEGEREGRWRSSVVGCIGGWFGSCGGVYNGGADDLSHSVAAMKVFLPSSDRVGVDRPRLAAAGSPDPMGRAASINNGVNCCTQQ